MELPQIVAAPMAGGPSTPALVNAVSFGFLALGTCTADSAREQLAAARAPFGANLFYPQPEPSPDDVTRVARQLGADVPDADVTSGFAEKFELVLDAAPAVVSSTFGCFTAAEMDRLHAAGSEAWVTVTNESEAREAARRGADGLVVQGPLAGGHRGTWDQNAEPDGRALGDLLAAVRAAVDLPLIAAGGVRGPGDVEKLLRLGADSVACGSAFLLADEAGTSERNRAMLRAGGVSVSSRAFSGRWARGVETDFTRAHPDMPAIYPYLKPMVPDNPYCLVGADFASLAEAPAAEIEAALTP
ncbi:nitronate monooxygenase [uncultured Corynebacterium sp.]|uniref:nitronate monooxygenase n=1 Tax=uncultured Corynebacterium sp. TaxID=159447 RepID=UPI00259A31E1|nr:nitronate monooxygenase [uncultured Corynebacterium sp.]